MAEVDHFVIQHIRHMLTQPDMSGKAMNLLQQEGSSPEEAEKKLQNIEQIWNSLFAQEQRTIIQTLVKTVWASEEGLDIWTNSEGLQCLIQQMKLKEEAA